MQTTKKNTLSLGLMMVMALLATGCASTGSELKSLHEAVAQAQATADEAKTEAAAAKAAADEAKAEAATAKAAAAAANEKAERMFQKTMRK